MKNVPRIGRILDVVGLLLFGAGGALFAWAWVGFRGVQDYVAPADAPLWSAVGVADRYWRLQKIGAGLMIGGMVVFVVAWWTARLVAGRSAAALQAALSDERDGAQDSGGSKPSEPTATRGDRRSTTPEEVAPGPSTGARATPARPPRSP